MKRDLYQTITDTIIKELENGVRPWIKPWSSDHFEGRVQMPRRHDGTRRRSRLERRPRRDRRFLSQRGEVDRL